MKSTAALTALLLVTAAAPVAQAKAPGDGAKVAAARSMIAAWRAKDWRKVADLFAPDGALRSMMLPPVTGREAIYARMSALGAGIQSITLDVEHMGVIDGRVYIERTDRFVYKGKTGAVPVVGVLVFDGRGRISEWREYYDRATLLREMGEPVPAGD